MTRSEIILRLRQCAPGETVTVTLEWPQAQWWAEYLFRTAMNQKDKAQ